jgi:hypothetical protein
MNRVMRRQIPFPAMRRVAVAGLVVAVLFTGCQGSPTPKSSGLGVGRSPAPLGPAAARIVSVNSEHEIVVIEFTSRVMPALGTRVTIYRNGKPVGAVRITEPAHAPLSTADIVEGEVHVGDEAR